MYQNIFERYEKKYLLNRTQYTDISNLLSYVTENDQYSESRIASLYYDTPDYLLIRRSLEKPVYKEKLRLRCYTVPDDNTPCFIELKKKYSGIVYKRRMCTDYKTGFYYLSGNTTGLEKDQILNETDYFLKLYPGLSPAMACFYDRRAVRGREDENIRITFDSNILYRFNALDLRKGTFGERLFTEEKILMEIKVNGAIPIWLSRILDELKLYPSSFSKYGTAYNRLLTSKQNKGDIFNVG